MTTPQEQPKTLEEMLADLRHLLADLDAQRRHAEGQLAGWLRRQPSEFARANVAAWKDKIAWATAKRTTVDQTIAILEVITTRDFRKLHATGVDGEATVRVVTRSPRGMGVLTELSGENVLDVLLKAHATIKQDCES